MAITFLLPVLLSAADSRSINGEWESISVESSNPFFKDRPPDKNRGSVKLTLMDEGSFRWINSGENQVITGQYRVESCRIILVIGESKETVVAEFQMINDNLVIITDDGFKYTFERKLK